MHVKKSKQAKKVVESHHVAGYPKHGKSPGKGSAGHLTDARKHGNSNKGVGPSPRGPKSYHPEGT